MQVPQLHFGSVGMTTPKGRSLGSGFRAQYAEGWVPEEQARFDAWLISVD
jgi:hypothetical protein